MSLPSTSLATSLIDVDRSSSTPLYRQISSSLREAITDGTFSPGTRLPPTRVLADKLEVSRNTIINAFDQLHSEGYLDRKRGSGTYVSDELPERHTQVRRLPEEDLRSLHLVDTSTRTPSTSEEAHQVTGQPLSLMQDPGSNLAFRPGIPALDALPLDTWSNLVSRRWRCLPPQKLVYGEPAGFPPLRRTVAEYLRTARGVRCEAEQVLIVSGIQQAITLTARTLLDKGDSVWVEDPGYIRMRKAFTAAGAVVRPIPIDEDGLDFSSHSHISGNRNFGNGSSHEVEPPKDNSPQLVGITPSHQFPLGVTMSLSRRHELLEWAARTDTWIFEDDYDSEYRFSGRPLAALQGLDNAGRVLYAGTFSKVLFPALRLGYLVVPEDLTEHFIQMRALADRCPPRVHQMALNDLIKEGHLERHIRKMRTLYASRQSALLEAIEEHLSSILNIEASNGGLHLVGWLPEDIDDYEASRRLKNSGIVAPPLSFYSSGSLDRGGLLLGYACVSEEEIQKGVNKMARTLKSS